MTATTLSRADSTIVADPQQLPAAAAEQIVALLKTALETSQKRRLRVCLCGGSTPFGLYQALTQVPYKNQIPWGKIDFFIGDERFVPYTDPQSNFGNIKKILFEPNQISPARLHPIPIAATAQLSAQLYGKQLQELYGAPDLSKNVPFFDLMLLGLGEDGHTASLFPGQTSVAAKQPWAIAVEGPKPPVHRITLTLPVINASRFILFLVKGASKRKALNMIQKGDSTLPAAYVQAREKLFLLTDRCALPSAPQSL